MPVPPALPAAGRSGRRRCQSRTVPRHAGARASRAGRGRRGHEPGRLPPRGTPSVPGHRAGTAVFPGSPLMLDVLITGGTVYDGTGGAPVRADVGIVGDRVARIGRPGADGLSEAAL